MSIDVRTDRLYYDDPYLFEFNATVVETIQLKHRLGLVLDRTAFYPTSGGQPNDLGMINDARLLDCYEDELTALVIHVVDKNVEAGTVHCRIDASRRLDHMQQHSGQHVLSQAFVELYGWPTVSFHLGAMVCTIDLPAELVTREQAECAADLANRVIQENRIMAVRYISQEDLAHAGLRKPTERTGEIRIIDIAGYDRSACGGTHVRTTGEIGSVLITRLERAKKQARVEFICGNRVTLYSREANRTLEAISQTVSAPVFETAAAVRSLWEDYQKARKRIDDLESELLDHEASRFPVENGLAIGIFKNRGLDNLKILASKICTRPGTVALLGDESDQLRVVFARSADSTVDVSAILKKTLERFGGRGGGRPSLAQGGGLGADSAQVVLRFAAEQIPK